MLKIKSVEIEGFHNVDKKHYEFKNINYLKGPNGSGKSTVLQAIQLALLGYIPGSNKTKEGIFRHSNGKVLAVTVDFTGDDDIRISRVWSGTGSSISSIVDIEPKGYDISDLVSNIELPIFNFSDFLNLTANKQKDWFLNFLPKETWNIDWKKELTRSLDGTDIQDIEFFKTDIADDLNSCELEGLENIRHANEYLKSELSAHKSELSRLQGTIQSYIYYDDIEDTDVSEIDKDIVEYQNLKSTCIKRDSELQAVNKLTESLSEYSDLSESLSEDKKYNNCLNRISTLQTELEYQKSVQTELIKQKYAVQNEIDAITRTVNSGDICPVLNESCDRLVNHIQENNEQIKADRLLLESLEAKLSEVDKLISTKSSVLQSCIDVKNRIAYSYSMRDTLKSQLEDLTSDTKDIDNELTIEVIDSKLKELYDLKAKILANEKYSSVIDKITKEKYCVENEIEALKIWINLTGVNGLQNGNSEYDPFALLKSSMDKYISKLFGRRTKTEVNMQKKANSFSFGVSRNKTYIPYDLLSSGEKCLYALALMLALTDISNTKLKLVLVDDMFDHLDDKNTESLFNVLTNITNIQMIFAGVKDIKKGANIINIK